MWSVWRPDAATVLQDKKARIGLARYFDVMQDLKPAKFMIAKKLEADFIPENSLEHLWILHDQLTQDYYKLEKKIDTKQEVLGPLETPEKSYLDLKSEITRRIMGKCYLCTRRCGFNRLAGELGLWC